MQYVRTFNLQSAHLNSARAYQILWEAAINKGGMIPVSSMFEVVRDCHGHNVKIEVKLEDDMASGQSWLVDDVILTDLVMEWDNTNLSLHSDFLLMQMRATTENMAAVLITKLRTSLGHAVVKSVKVWETADIYALAS